MIPKDLKKQKNKKMSKEMTDYFIDKAKRIFIYETGLLKGQKTDDGLGIKWDDKGEAKFVDKIKVHDIEWCIDDKK